MNPLHEASALYTRRQFFGRSVLGLGTAALATLLGSEARGADGVRRGIPGLPELPHFAPKAKRVIYLFQNGAPSHVDLFDYKPKLREWHGRQIPDEVVGGRRFSTMTGGQTDRPVLGEITKFAQHGHEDAETPDDDGGTVRGEPGIVYPVGESLGGQCPEDIFGRVPAQPEAVERLVVGEPDLDGRNRGDRSADPDD